MSKVAINKCYGGFSISKECAKWIENKYGIDLSKEYDYGAYYFDEKRHDRSFCRSVFFGIPFVLWLQIRHNL